MAIPNVGGQTYKYVYDRAMKLGVPFRVVDRPLGKHEPLPSDWGKWEGSERIIEAHHNDETGIVMEDGNGAVAEIYRANIAEPPSGHTESDRAARAELEAAAGAFSASANC